VNLVEIGYRENWGSQRSSYVTLKEDSNLVDVN